MLVRLTSVSVLLLLTGVFVGELTLIWSILMLECITKIPVENALIIECDGFMYISAVSSVSNISSILGVNERNSCWICG